MKNAISKELLQTIEQIHTLLHNKNVDWLVGGSCGLLLQGVDLIQPPRDLDIYVDAAGASVVYDALLSFAIDQLVMSQTAIYTSILSHFQIANIQVEVVGGFEVHALQSDYHVEVSQLLLKYGTNYTIGECNIGLMPLAHELIFNMLRQRPDRYMAIAEKMRTDPVIYLTPLNKILERNSFDTAFVKKLNELLDLEGGG
jgi:hypothetical protein